MRRLILSLAAIAAVAGPMAASATSAQAQSWDRRESHDDRRGDRWDRRDDRRDHRYDRRDNRYDNRRHYQPPPRWDSSRYNGYYYQNRWSYGPPPTVYYSHPQYRPGYVAWRRGAVLPPQYRGYVIHDYHRYRLRPPPRGYAWHRVGDDYLLAAVATGIIFEIINNR
ncbi:RcnB family protein [Phenylobacterium sp.]|uniref:RcnB family protein n=1 Tax=Phenylobacterium sp. TaxID=1871053 RepID=UPI0026333BF3|nr:RcnB family protein [Phenylobacterium sp.]